MAACVPLEFSVGGSYFAAAIVHLAFHLVNPAAFSLFICFCFFVVMLPVCFGMGKGLHFLCVCVCAHISLSYCGFLECSDATII